MKEKKQNFNFPKYMYEHVDLAYIPSTAYVSLNQDGITKCKAFVTIGDSVEEGQLIASNRKASLNIHSPIPGTVVAFETRMMPNGKEEECIVISLRGSFSYTGKERRTRSWKYDTSSRLLSQIHQQGIVNTLDSHLGSLSHQINSLSANQKTLGVLLFDSDPSITVSTTSTHIFKREIFEGSKICARAMNADGIVFFISTSMINSFSESDIQEIINDIPHFFIPVNCNLYPSASPRELETLIVKHKSSMPAAIKANMKICIDTTTALSIYKGIVSEFPSTDTLVEINGEALHESHIYSTKIGTPIKRLLEECGGTEKLPAKVITNGLVKGIAISDLNIPVTKYLKSITLLSATSVPDQRQSPCIHCGKCRHTCPSGLLPDKLYGYYIHKFPIDNAVKLSAALCDDCALCNTSCPSRLPLFQTISLIKEEDNETEI